MKLNHANLCASDVAALSDIFSRNFALKRCRLRRPRRPGAITHCCAAATALPVITKIGHDSPQSYPTDFHVGSMLDAPEQVHAKHKNE